MRSMMSYNIINIKNENLIEMSFLIEVCTAQNFSLDAYCLFFIVFIRIIICLIGSSYHKHILKPKYYFHFLSEDKRKKMLIK